MEELREEKKWGFFKRIYNSIFHFNSYSRFVVEKPSKTILYFLKLILFTSFIYSIILISMYYFNANEILNYFKNDISDFTITNGKIDTQIEKTSIEKTIAGNNIYILLDVNQISQQQYDDDVKQMGMYDLGVLCLNDRIEIKFKNFDFWNNTLMYSDGGEGFYTKQDILDLIKGYNIPSLLISCVILITIVMLILFLSSVLPNMVIWFVVAYLSNIFNRVRLKSRALGTIVIYSYTIAIVLQALFMCVNALTGFTINNFDIMIILVSAIYLFTALIYVRTHAITEQILTSKMKYEKEKREDEQKEDEDQ